MTTLFTVLGLASLLTLATFGIHFQNGDYRSGRPKNFGYNKIAKYHNNYNYPTGDESQLPQNVLSMDDLLDELDWRDYEGENYCTWTRNQHMPYYCGSCWAMSTTSALADRYMIRRGNSFPKLTIAPQVLLDCDHVDYGCHGGDAAAALSYIYDNYITDETCTAYRAKGWDVGRECTEKSICENCDSSSDPCFAVDEKFYQKYGITQWGFVSGEENMMKELTRGPIICAMAVDDEFYYNYTGGIFNDTSGYDDLDHLISIVGYGTSEEGVDFWIGRNSWGTFWGIDGYFKIIRGTDNLAIEEECYWMEPDTTDFSNVGDYEWARNWGGSDDYTYSSKDWATKANVARKRRLKEERLQNEKQNNQRRKLSGNGINFKTELIESDDITVVTNEQSGFSYMMRKSDSSSTKELPNWGLLHDPNEEDTSVIKSPLPGSILSYDELPDEFSWHNVDGINYLTTARNQHIPTYCGSCWAFSTTTMVSDRINIQRYQDDSEIWPEINVSPQALINSEYAGDCDGGYPKKAIEYMYEYGLPDETCQIYQAESDPHGNDTDLNVCYNCDSNTGFLWPGICYNITDYDTYYVSEYGSIKNNVTEMKSEIYERGPIACEMTVVGSFWHYNGGVYSNSGLDTDDTDHVITVVGWSYDENKDQEYWIARNSWGMYWGEDGFFRIEMYENNLNIEEHCWWAVVEWNTTQTLTTSEDDDSSDDVNEEEEIVEEEVDAEMSFGQKLARLALHSLL